MADPSSRYVGLIDKVGSACAEVLHCSGWHFFPAPYPSHGPRTFGLWIILRNRQIDLRDWELIPPGLLEKYWEVVALKIHRARRRLHRS